VVRRQEMKKIKYYISKEKGLRKTEDKKRKSELKKKTLEEKKKKQTYPS
jgi:hypothetical protein